MPSRPRGAQPLPATHRSPVIAFVGDSLHQPTVPLTVPLLCPGAAGTAPARRRAPGPRPPPAHVPLRAAPPTGRSRPPVDPHRASKHWYTFDSRFTLNVRPRPSPRWIGQAQRRCGPEPFSRAVRPRWSSTRPIGSCRFRWAKSSHKVTRHRQVGFSWRRVKWAGSRVFLSEMTGLALVPTAARSCFQN